MFRDGRLPARLSACVGLLLAGCRPSLATELAGAEALMLRGHYHAAEARLAPAAARWRQEGGGARQAAAVAAHRRLAELYDLYLDAPPRALLALAHLAAVGPPPEARAARWRAARLLMRAGEAGRAALALEAIAADADSPHRHEARLALVAAHLATGDVARAEAVADALLAASHPADPAESRWASCRALARLAEVQVAGGRATEAAALYARLGALAGRGEVGAEMSFRAGCARQEAGLDEPALAAFVAAYAEHPDPAMVGEKIQRTRQRLAEIHPTGKIMSGALRPALAEARGRRGPTARPPRG